MDGDTIKVSINGGPTQTVRIIGVDTPETKDPRKPVMCYGAEATAKTQELIDLAGGHVQLEKDVSETDKYDRLLRYVWLIHPDGKRMLNEELVKGGYAQSSTYPPDVKYQDLFVSAQREAREQGRGLWGACGSFGVPAATKAPETSVAPPAPTQEPAAGGNCDPSYPGVCIPPPPPDLDCKDVSYRRFAVVAPDPHRFDSDHDGIGCET
ncbi:thermonuclease family protein [Nitrolancea hollandica]|uniref:WD40 domain protein beta Propeller n=1 Tax=Nitrolancea hollandica Lb TaxID=1129897 RepID=I4ELK0_9BACT